MTHPSFEKLAASMGIAKPRVRENEFADAEHQRAQTAKLRYLSQENRLTAEPLHVRQQEAVDIRKHRTGKLRVEPVIVRVEESW